MQINVTRSSMPSYEEYCEEIKSLWDSHWITNMGEKHQQLQAQLESYLDVENVALYTNGHLALEGALSALDMKKGGEIITTPFTFASTTHAIVRSGFTPVFCDINEDDYTINADKIEELITENTVAILPVHVYGNICDTEKIDRLAKKYGLRVIYDAAHAFGETINGKGVANLGDMSMFSFHATKVYNTIEGGALCFNNNEYKQLINDMKNFGIRGQESCMYVGGNAKMNEFQAAMGICNLRHIDKWIADRERVYKRYISRLKGVDGIRLPAIQKNVRPNYAYFPVVFENYKYSRDEIHKKLLQAGVNSRKYFYPLTCDFECYKDSNYVGTDNIAVAKKVSQGVLTLPIYPELSDDIIDMICDTILG